MKELYTVWILEAYRIASFHPMEDYRKQSFMTHEFFMNYLQQLQNQGYKFQ